MKRKPPNTASGMLVHGSLPVEVGHVSVGGLPRCPYGPHPQRYAASTGGGTTTDSLPLQAETLPTAASARRRRTGNDDDTSIAPLNNLARGAVTRSSAARPP